MNIFYMCTDPIVYGVCTIQVVMIISLAYYLQQFEYPQWDWNKLVINGIACYCCLPCVYKPTNLSNRILFIVLLLSCIIFITIFTAIFLAGNIRYGPQIDSISKIVANNLKLAGDRFAFLKLSEQNEVITENKENNCM